MPTHIDGTRDMTPLVDAGIDAHFDDPNLRIVEVLLQPFIGYERLLGGGRMSNCSKWEAAGDQRREDQTSCKSHVSVLRSSNQSAASTNESRYGDAIG